MTHETAVTRPRAEVPAPSNLKVEYGSDVIAQMLRALDVSYVALNPGASYRGLHDSLVNSLGNRDPQLVLALHEGHAVAVAHGFAKVTGRAMAVALHSNVGLMHGTMGMFNAWCDRAPMIVLGATGPVDAAERRPWIDWIHTSRDQGAMVRGHVKWDDQPASPAAACEAMLRASWLTNTVPKAPVYLNFDAGMQEAPLAADVPLPDPARFRPAALPGLSDAQLAQAAAMLRAARAPVILLGRAGRDPAGWQARVALAEALAATVVTDSKLAVGFPTAHPLHAGYEEQARPALAGADLILSLDWVDLAGTLRSAGVGPAPAARIVQVTLDHQLHNGANMDHQALPPVDLFLPADPDTAVQALARHLGAAASRPFDAPDPPSFEADGSPLTVARIARALRAALEGVPNALCRIPGGWDHRDWPLADPLDYLGSNGGAGLGGSAGIAVGCALGLRHVGSDRLAVGVFGDGDFLMGSSALWTAAHYGLGLLCVIANNRRYHGDVVHQGKVAEMRSRNLGNRTVGLDITEPDIDFSALAASTGGIGFGPVERDHDLPAVLAEAVAAAAAGRVVIVDVRTGP